MLPRVMIVEDEEIIREIYTLKLEMEGYPVLAVENGQAALSALDDFQPDIIVLDMMMPVMGGLEFMRQYADMNGKARVIVFSNMSDTEQISTMTALGAHDYWVKSDYTPEKMLDGLSAHWKSLQAHD